MVLVFAAASDEPLLRGFDQDLREMATEQLQAMGVTVRLGHEPKALSRPSLAVSRVR